MKNTPEGGRRGFKPQSACLWRFVAELSQQSDSASPSSHRASQARFRMPPARRLPGLNLPTAGLFGRGVSFRQARQATPLRSPRAGHMMHPSCVIIGSSCVRTKRAAVRVSIWRQAIFTHLVARTEIDRRIAEQLESLLGELGFVLVRVRTQVGSDMCAQIMADRPEGGIDLDDCARISRAVRPVFDKLRPGGGCRLEVSSPGVDRPLTRLTDFADHVGAAVRLETATAISGRRRFRGQLLGVCEAGPAAEGQASPRIAVRDEDGEAAEIPFESISAARLASPAIRRRQERA